MSKPAAGSFFETDFFKAVDMSKLMGDFKYPMNLMADFKYPMTVEPLLTIQRKNIEAISALSQAAFQSFQSLAHRQAELLRQTLEDSANVANTIMQCPTPQEKVIRQAEASKVVVDRCLASARDVSETITRCNYQTIETVSNRMNESLEELRTAMQSCMTRAAA